VTTGTRTDVSVIVPTRDEAENVDELVSRTRDAMVKSKLTWELLFVDDSDDDTPARAMSHAAAGLPVRVMHRAPGDRIGGLSMAVTAGFAHAQGGVLAVMDADLQHPPEVLADLVTAIVYDGADVSVASRYCAGAHADATDGLNGTWRLLVSHGCRWLVWTVRPRLLVGTALRPTGYKILLELLARGRWDKVVEVPYHFAARERGTSKSELRQGVIFLRHLVRLVADRGAGSPIKVATTPADQGQVHRHPPGRERRSL